MPKEDLEERILRALSAISGSEWIAPGDTGGLENHYVLGAGPFLNSIMKLADDLSGLIQEETGVKSAAKAGRRSDEGKFSSVTMVDKIKALLEQRGEPIDRILKVVIIPKETLEKETMVEALEKIAANRHAIRGTESEGVLKGYHDVEDMRMHKVHTYSLDDYDGAKDKKAKNKPFQERISDEKKTDIAKGDVSRQ